MCGAHLILWEPNALVRGDRNTAICTAMPRVVATLDPRLRKQVENVDVVKPYVREVLAANDEETVGGDRGKVRVAGVGNVGVVGRSRRTRHPASRAVVEEAYVLENTEVLRVIRLGFDCHTAKDNEMVPPCGGHEARE